MTTIEMLGRVIVRLTRKLAATRTDRNETRECLDVAMDQKLNAEAKLREWEQLCNFELKRANDNWDRIGEQQKEIEAATEARTAADSKLAAAETRLREYEAALCEMDSLRARCSAAVITRDDAIKERDLQTAKVRTLSDDCGKAVAACGELRTKVASMSKVLDYVERQRAEVLTRADDLQSEIEIARTATVQHVTEIARLRGIIGQAMTIGVPELAGNVLRAAAAAPAAPRRMKANECGLAPHHEPHDWRPTCDFAPKCEPVNAHKGPRRMRGNPDLMGQGPHGEEHVETSECKVGHRCEPVDAEATASVCDGLRADNERLRGIMAESAKTKEVDRDK